MRWHFSGAGFIFLAFLAACTARSDEINSTVPGAIGGTTDPGSTPPPPPSPAPAPSGTFPNTDDGKPIMQLGLGPIAYYWLEDPFLNLLEVSSYSWTARGGATADMDFNALYKAGLVDRTTMLPTAIPSGYAYMTSGLFRAGARTYPDYYAGTYVFDWSGDADARCGFNAPTRKVSSNRIECDYSAANKDWARIELTRVTSTFKNPRLYRKEDEAAINAGGVFSAKYLGLLSGYKVIRTMDVQGTNGSWIRKAAELSTKTMFGWGSSAGRNADIPELPRGAPLALLSDLAVATRTALWLNVPPVMGAPDAIEDAQYQTDANAIKAFGAANLDTIAGSPEWRGYADAVVSALKTENYPTSTMVYQEIGNEIWNFANPFWRMTYYYWGMGEALKARTGAGGEGFRYALGWLTANYAVQFDAALRAAGRDNQAWTIVLASQNAYLGRTTAALQGAKDYFVSAGLDPAVWMKKIGVSTATYYNGIFDLKTGLFPAADEATRDAAWAAAIAADPAGLMTKFADWVISGSGQEGLTNVVAMRAQQKAEAEKFGAVFIGDYEGNSHLQVPASLQASPDFIAWLRSYLLSADAERVDQAWVEALYSEAPNAIIANYESIGSFIVDGSGKFEPATHPWIDGFWTDDTGRDKAFAPYLRAPCQKSCFQFAEAVCAPSCCNCVSTLIDGVISY
ncbi:MAG TPA: hypothetical protein VNH64_01905 [Parvularculaceae bacterium]|nr:hypothetical protein [Parvularculaceae bacterium]